MLRLILKQTGEITNTLITEDGFNICKKEIKSFSDGTTLYLYAMHLTDSQGYNHIFLRERLVQGEFENTLMDNAIVRLHRGEISLYYSDFFYIESEY